MAQNTKQREFSEQDILNRAYDRSLGVLLFASMGWDGSQAVMGDSDNLAISVQTSGSDTYVGEAAPGTSLSASTWKAYKVDSSGNLTFADGNATYDNVATDLTALTYS